MNNGKICVSVCAATTDELIKQIRKAEEFADVIEVRFDCLNPDEVWNAADNLPSIAKQYLMTFRPLEQGGRRQLTLRERLKFWEHLLWKQKGLNFLVDYEFDMDFPLQPASERAIVSMHDFAGIPVDLPAQYEALSSLTGKKTIKIALRADDITDTIPIWKFLKRARSENKNIIPIAMGEAGKWTRILGLAHGAFMTYASLDAGSETSPGQISARDMRDIYRVKELDENTGVYGIIGGDTTYSMSPWMHNTAFKAANLNSVFVPLQVRNLDEFMRRMVKPATREIELNFKGFSVTNPHKQAIMKHLDVVDDAARKIGSVNTVKIENGKFHGYNTDADGFIAPLKTAFGDLSNTRVAVAGAGGAARSCIYALHAEGANVTVFARDKFKAETLSKEFGVRFEQLTTDNRQPTTSFDILVNATPLGTKGELENETIATAEQLPGVKLVYDLIYNPAETRLMREAKAANVPTIGGLEMLVGQGVRQFEIWTGKTATADEMRNSVTERLR